MTVCCFPAANSDDAQRICTETDLQFASARPMSPHDHKANHNGYVHGGSWFCQANAVGELSEQVRAIPGIVFHEVTDGVS